MNGSDGDPQASTWDDADPSGWGRVVIVLAILVAIAFGIDIACGYTHCPSWVHLGP